MAELVLMETETENKALLPALQTEAARNLDEVYRTMAMRPLVTQRELAAFYRDMNPVRGGDKIAHIKRNLERAHSVSHFKGFFMGHSGVGKSTEINRLTGFIADRFRVVRLNALEDLNPADFRPFDVLFVLILNLMQAIHTANMGDKIAPELLNDLYNWFRISDYTQFYEAHQENEASKEAGMPKKISEFIGLLFNIKESRRYITSRQEKTTEYSYKTMGQLVKLMNRLFVAANLLIQAEGREWVIIGEEFDKPGVSPARVEELFIEHANIFTELQTHLIFNIPSALAYSEKAQALPKVTRYPIFDTPVYDAQHQPHKAGREALRSVMDARMNPGLFAEGQQERLIVASGGNLSELFSLTVAAADNAALRLGANGKIEAQDVTQAIGEKRRDYRNALGSSPYDANPVPYVEKAARLEAVYNLESGYRMPDRVLYILILARAVQEFNGESWLGLHPLVVDILKADGGLKLADGGETPGGTI